MPKPNGAFFSEASKNHPASAYIATLDADKQEPVISDRVKECGQCLVSNGVNPNSHTESPSDIKLPNTQAVSNPKSGNIIGG